MTVKAASAPRLRGLPPIVDERARVLILGSFPSEASLAAQHYYAHPQNQFWRLLAAVLDVPLGELDYAGKQRTLRARGIAVWDVYGLCEREGSLDSAIRSAQPNDFSRVTQIAGGLQRVCFNGKTAGRFVRGFAELGLETCVLPSSSPAYTLAFSAASTR
jgi:TDG/mug DNA glycosylase family protein